MTATPSGTGVSLHAEARFFLTGRIASFGRSLAATSVAAIRGTSPGHGTGPQPAVEPESAPSRPAPWRSSSARCPTGPAPASGTSGNAAGTTHPDVPSVGPPQETNGDPCPSPHLTPLPAHRRAGPRCQPPSPPWPAGPSTCSTCSSLLSVAKAVGHQIFPAESETLSLALVFASFAVSIVMRPAGAALFGELADRKGRKTIMVTVMAGVGLSTASMGLVPTYASIGVIAPITFLVLRVIQGLFVGGVTATTHTLGTESVPPRWRGLMSVVLIGAGGAGLGAAMASITFIVVSRFLPR